MLAGAAEEEGVHFEVLSCLCYCDGSGLRGEVVEEFELGGDSEAGVLSVGQILCRYRLEGFRWDRKLASTLVIVAQLSARFG